MSKSGSHPQSFGRALRLSKKLEFEEVFGKGLRLGQGPLTLCALANGKEYSRLGLAVGKKVGNAVRRHRLKRLLREAFRTSRDQLPRGWDFYILTRPHDFYALSEYQRLLLQLASRLAKRAEGP